MEFYASTTTGEKRVYEDTYPENYVKKGIIEIYKMPEEWEEEEKILNYGENNKENLVCTIDGSLLLFEQGTIDGEDIVVMSDDFNEVLEHIAAAVESKGNPFPEDTFAIEEITFGPACDSKETFIEVLKRLPLFIFKIFNVKPDIAAFPLPLPYLKSNTQKIKEGFAKKIYDDAVKAFQERVYNASQGKDFDEGEDDNNKIRLVLDEEQMNYVLGKFNKDNPYPLEAKNKPLWDLFESAGFKEIGETMVLWDGE